MGPVIKNVWVARTEIDTETRQKNNLLVRVKIVMDGILFFFRARTFFWLNLGKRWR